MLVEEMAEDTNIKWNALPAEDAAALNKTSLF